MAGVPSEVDPKEVEAARSMWRNFTTLVKYSSIAVAVVMLLLMVLVYQPPQ